MIQKIKLNEIVVGEPLPFDVRDAAGQLLLRKGSMIDSDRTRESLISRGIYWADPVKETATKPPKEPKVEHKINPFEAVDEIQTKLDRAFSKMNEDDSFTQRVVDLAKLVQDACRVDADAMLASIILEKGRRYSIKHSLDCAIVCEIVGIVDGMSADERLVMLCAALTQNVAMLEMQDKLQTMKVSLPPDLRKMMQTHPERGAAMLAKAGVEDESWITMVLQHHESYDGSGYPKGLSGDAISRAASLIALADMFSARMVDRGYKDKEMSAEAVRNIFQDKGFLHPELKTLMVKVIGMYPPGTLVRLANHEVGIVTRRGDPINCPIVHALVGSRDEPFATPLRRETVRTEFAIKSVLTQDQAAITINRNLLWQHSI